MFFHNKYPQAAWYIKGVIVTELGGVETQYFASPADR
jgi:hypothetical protein